MVRVAVVQATPVVLDGPASVEKACGLIAEAAAGGAKLIALPEGFVPIMPRSRWGHHYGLIVSPRGRAAPPLWDNAVDVDGPLAATLGDAARQAEAWVAIGVNEREDGRPAPCELAPVVHARWRVGPPSPKAGADDARAHLLGPGRGRRPGRRAGGVRPARG